MKKLLFLLMLSLGMTFPLVAQQVIGSFPQMDGGFESQTNGVVTTQSSVSCGNASSIWTRQNTSATDTVFESGGRSGPKYVKHGSTASTRLQSPTAADAAIASATAYTVQFYYKSSIAVASGRLAISPCGTSNPGSYVNLNLPSTGGVWTLVQTTVTSGNSTNVPRYGLGVFGYSAASGGRIDVDDYVIYLGAADNTAPNAPGTVTISNATTLSLDLSWDAASGGVDGGGYVVVRYSSDPGTGNDPNQHGIYAVGNEVATGGIVRYIGTGTSFTDADGLTASTQYWYKVYTVDKAFNYSDESTATGATTGGPVILLSTTSVTGLTAYQGVAGTSKNYAVSGDNLTDQVVVTAPANFEVSVDDINFSSSVNLPVSGGNVVDEPKTVYVRIAAGAAPGAVSGNITHASTGATTLNVAVSGTVYFAEPSNHVTSFAGTTPTCGSVTLTWNDNDGANLAAGFMIVANKTGSFTDPIDGTWINDSSSLALGRSGSAVYHVAHGVQTATFWGLNGTTTYYFIIYPYSNSGTNVNYKTTAPVPTANVTTGSFIQPVAAWTMDSTQIYVGGTGINSFAANLGQPSAMFYANGSYGSTNMAVFPTDFQVFAGTTINDPLCGFNYPLNQAAFAVQANVTTPKSIVIKFSMAGYSDPVFSFATRGTATGQNTQQWAWSLDGTTYTNFGTNTADNSTNFIQRILDLSSINELDGASSVYLKLTLSGATVTGGNTRLDNIMIRATATVPVVQAHDITFSGIGATGMTVNWTNGDGANRIVIMNTSNSFTNPANGTDPTANPVYSGSGEQVIFNGSGNSVPVTGLTASTTYWFRVYEYNGTGVGTNYLTTTATLNPNSQTTTSSAVAPFISDPTFAGITSSSALLGGNITSDGGSAILERGTVWNTTGNPVITDNKEAEGGTSTGIFTHTRTLPAGSHIFFKAYATNTAGTGMTDAVSFYTLSNEPTTHVTDFVATTTGPNTVDLTWSTSATGADGYLIIKKAGTSEPTGTPADATGYSVGQVIGDGTVAAIVTPGTLLTTGISGLSSSTQYYFTIVPFAWDGANYQTYNYYTDPTIPSATATTQDAPPTTYTWSTPSGNWSVPGNWNPSRDIIAPNDVLVFDGNVTPTATVTMDFTSPENIGSLKLINNVSLLFDTLNVTARVLNIGAVATTAPQFEVAAGSTLTLSAKAACSLYVKTGYTGSVSGNILFTRSAHKLYAADSAAIVFHSGSVITQGIGCSGSIFTSTGTANIIQMESGSTFIMLGAGANPFGLSQPNSKVLFKAGSLYKHRNPTAPSFSGRTYANFELDTTATITASGNSKLTVEDLIITRGTFNFNMATTIGHQIRGNIIVATGAILNFSPSSAAVVKLNGSTPQSINGPGAISSVYNNTLEIDNPNGVTLNTNFNMNGQLKLTNGLLTLGAGDLFLGTQSAITGTPSATNMIVATSTGMLKKGFATGFTGSFTFPVGDNTGVAEYSPATVTFTAGTFATGNYIGVNLVDAKYPSFSIPDNHITRYWNIAQNGITDIAAGASFQYLADDVVGNESDISCVRVVPLPWSYFDPADVVNHVLTATGLDSFGTFTGSSAVTSKSLSLKFFIEGLYAGAGTMVEAMDENGPHFGTGVADQVIIELHDQNNYSTDIYSSGDVNLTTSGEVSITDIPSALSGDYYITIKNRNSIVTVSAFPVSFAGSSVSYDFSTAASQAYMDNQVDLGDGYFGIWSGDVNQDGIVDSGDINPVDNASTAITFGYVPEDINGDGIVDSTDINFVDNNSTAVIIGWTP